ncbi:cation/H(+) antiporter 15-like [Curcuma longa]|uniref:cation/H(+) antiporter 15-like n=1 Tax=Curcuma longa TaxID=136217 RepID=UPI003D9EB46A
MAQPMVNQTTLDQLSRPAFSYGFFYHEDPLRDTTSLLLLQFLIAVLTSRFLYFLLSPLNQPRIVCDIMGGMIGSSPKILLLLSYLRIPAMSQMADSYQTTLFRDDVISYTRLLAAYGMTVKFFLIGVKIDPTLAWRSGKRAAILGFCNMVIPFLFLLALRYPYLRMAHAKGKHSTFIDGIGDPEIFLHVAATVAASSPPVIADVLTDLRLLNTELGRLAISASMVSEITRWCIFAVYRVISTAKKRHSYAKAIQQVVGTGVCMISLLSLVRPWAQWIVRQTPKGGRVAEWHILVMLLAVLAMGALGDALGLGFLDAPMVMGLLIPDGPPLGMALVEQLELFSTELLLPLFFLAVGYITNLDRIVNVHKMALMLLYILAGHVVKTLVSVGASFYYKTSIHKAAILGLMLNFKGLVELMAYIDIKGDQKFATQTFFALVMSIVTATGVISWLVAAFYDPLNARHAAGYRALQHLNPEEKFSAVATMLNEDAVPAMIDLFEVSSSETSAGQRSACIHVLHLTEMSGRANSVLVQHKNRKGELVNTNQMDRLHNAFLNHEKRKEGAVSVFPYTAVSPYATMHQDICSLALEKGVPFIVVPFPRCDSGANNEIEKAARNIVPQVISQAPCSVGILIHHGLTSSRPLVSEQFRYSVKVLFWGGNDDREALTYAARMARHPGVFMLVTRFRLQEEAAEGKDLSWDDVIFKEFARETAGNERVTVEEVAAKDINDTVEVIKSIGSECDLVMVGRVQCAESMLEETLGKWMETPELGVVGDMLASNDFVNFSFSVLVVQQHA